MNYLGRTISHADIPTDISRIKATDLDPDIFCSYQRAYQYDLLDQYQAACQRHSNAP